MFPLQAWSYSRLVYSRLGRSRLGRSGLGRSIGSVGVPNFHNVFCSCSNI
jgi:hypothetical protein